MGCEILGWGSHSLSGRLGVQLRHSHTMHVLTLFEPSKATGFEPLQTTSTYQSSLHGVPETLSNVTWRRKPSITWVRGRCSESPSSVPSCDHWSPSWPGVGLTLQSEETGRLSLRQLSSLAQRRGIGTGSEVMTLLSVLATDTAYPALRNRPSDVAASQSPSIGKLFIGLSSGILAIPSNTDWGRLASWSIWNKNYWRHHNFVSTGFAQQARAQMAEDRSLARTNMQILLTTSDRPRTLLLVVENTDSG